MSNSALSPKGSHPIDFDPDTAKISQPKLMQVTTTKNVVVDVNKAFNLDCDGSCNRSSNNNNSVSNANPVINKLIDAANIQAGAIQSTGAQGQGNTVSSNSKILPPNITIPTRSISPIPNPSISPNQYLAIQCQHQIDRIFLPHHH